MKNKNKAEGLALPAANTYYEAIAIKITWNWCKEREFGPGMNRAQKQTHTNTGFMTAHGAGKQETPLQKNLILAPTSQINKEGKT